MRIDAYSAVNQVYQTNMQTKKETVEKETVEKKTSRDDKIEISQVGKDMTVAKKAISEAPDLREDKVKAIKEQMEAGTYSVSSEAIADKLIDSFFGGIS